MRRIEQQPMTVPQLRKNIRTLAVSFHCVQFVITITNLKGHNKLYQKISNTYKSKKVLCILFKEMLD